MGRISKDDIEAAYTVARKVLSGRLDEAAGIEELVAARGMNSASATDYIRVLQRMVSGGKIRRTISAAAFRTYVDHILLDFDRMEAERTLESIREHTRYYASLGRGNLRSVEAVADDLESRILAS